MRSFSQAVAFLSVGVLLLVACSSDTGSSDSTIAPVAARERPAAGAAAATNQPVNGVATVDGNSGEWSLSNDLFADMYEAGKPDKPALSKLHLRYACETETLYVLVLTERIGSWSTPMTTTS